MQSRTAAPAQYHGAAKAAAFACCIHALVWSFAPPIYFGNLHSDTVEVLSWATHWDWGYFKHPPLIVWLFRLLLGAPGSRMVNLLILSQASVLLSAALIWRTVRIYASPRAALTAVVIYLASPPATYFATQVNHNSIVIPFGIAICCFGLRFFEEKQSSDALLLGIAAGLALLTKYQAAFFLMTLATIAAVIPGYRWVWRDVRGYGAALLALTIFAPHVWWDYEHNWRTLAYASSDRPLRTLADFAAGLNELLDGLLMCAVGPALAWLVLGRPHPQRAEGLPFRIGLLLAATPIAIMIGLGFLSGQVLRQGWLIPLFPASAIGLALMFRAEREGVAPRAIAWRAIFVSCCNAAAFAVFLFFRAWSGHAVTAYSLDSAELTESIQNVWRKQNNGPVLCLQMPNRSYALGTMLHLDPPPLVFDLPMPPHGEADLSPCRPTGGLIIVPEGEPVNAVLQAVGLRHERVSAANYPRIGNNIWTFELYFVSAER